MENAKKTLILHGTKTSSVLNSVLTQIYHLKRDNAIRFTKKNDKIRPFESGGETSLEFLSLKTDCSLFVVSSGILLLVSVTRQSTICDGVFWVSVRFPFKETSEQFGPWKNVRPSNL